MIKILIAFIIFAALAVFVLTRSGGDIDLGGEKHTIDEPPAAAPTAPAAASAASN